MKKRVLITGSTDGIGKQTAFRLAMHGQDVILHGRDKAKGLGLRNAIRLKCPNVQVEYVNANYTSFSEIEGMVEVLSYRGWIPDILINNAGIFQSTYETVTSHKIEKIFMVNYLASFYLTHLLVGFMLERRSASIVNVSSMIHAHNMELTRLVNPMLFNGNEAYSISKLLNILHANDVAAMYGERLSINSIHPGVIDTKLLRTGWGGGGSDVNSGADQLLYAALELPENTSGKYFEYSNDTAPAPIALNRQVQIRLRELSMTLIPEV